jgi:alanine racemase
MLPARVYAKVNLDAICLNVSRVIDKVGKAVSVMAIVKTDAYGHGAVPVAKALCEAGVDSFGVATVEEALQLRRNGISSPILILGYVFPEDYEKVIKNDIMHAVFRYENAVELSKKAVQMGKTAKIHIAVDTGMGRIGFQPNDESIEEIKKISLLENIEINGIFTHFACADEKDKVSCNAQKQLYLGFLEKIAANGIKIPVRHMDNSAGIIDYNSDFLDMVRVGIMTYGLYPSEEVNKAGFRLDPALEIISRVTFVKKVPAGFKVSYGSTYTTDKDTEIATVSIGYGDGYPRSLSNKGRVLINGKFAKIIGRVCMDQMMVDVTGMGVKQGDRVVVVGKDGENFISVEEVADTSGSFNYEFCCCINMRVPRVYIKDGKVSKTVDYIDAL